MLYQFKRKILPLLIIFVMLFSSMGAALADYETLGRKLVVTENGITYFIQGSYSKNRTKVSISTAQDKDYTEISISKNNGTVVSTTYDYKGKNFLGTPRYSESRQVIDLDTFDSQSIDSVTLQAIKYNSKTKEKLWFKYSYANGSEGTKTYLKISCNATYQIRTDNLAQTKKDNCNAYTNSIKKINSSLTTAKANALLAGVTMEIILAVVAVCVAFPPAAIVTAIVAAAGGAGVIKSIDFLTTSVNATILAFDKYEDVKDLYVTIRSYCTKL